MTPPKEPPPSAAHWTDRLKPSMPTRETLTAHPWLRPVAHRLGDPKLWHLQHEAVARGVAIGIFWAFAIPVAQFIVAAAHSVWWRANIPVAAGVTLITNPLTIGFWLWLAYQLGSFLLGAPPHVPMPDGAGMLAWLASYGGPAILGMGLFAVVGSASGYVLVKLAWRARVWLKRRYR
ncbi:MAG: hypothetical protein B7X59_13510 [Polaromonas sp. 39-63-203]|uniref:DUF2062 domain-containing protein n=1 Tax=Polaromonas sp. TaxID=1869339 RepID=UPI000BD74CAB|nr:DUF2062 domain-containing protein [Polaromonas sp.]OYY51215.1 MAG: hypothetical protein B7Y54_11035 [Polaromonas sp. 35-63-240]OYZ83290.1 MAG: hypothetical protein B7Y03_09965 [Polaromonas sp. 24-62-144]OZA94527.1 MAG: hypothetical protein B7X59_13510 [Polaromonas sp. 39-63-203]HQS33476.1 DUF2062 domain-containing protein [Polaromonas sp.]HQS92757.1 DUF2062 domain-containing protein [Polaromonas sp.]